MVWILEARQWLMAKAIIDQWGWRPAEMRPAEKRRK
jgi:hypothetical protein